MISVIEALSSFARGVAFVIDALCNIQLLFQSIRDTGCGFRWLFSPSYRKRLREDKDYFRKAWEQLSIVFGLFFIAIILGLVIYFVITNAA